MKLGSQLAKVALVATLTSALGLVGCSRDEVPTSPVGVDPFESEIGDASSGGLALGNAKLLVTTADPNQYYVTEHPDPWFFRSNVSNAQYFDLIVRNESHRVATNVEVLVTIPGNLGPGGWMILIDGHYFSSVEDFPLTDLRDSFYPRQPHFIYQPQGNAKFYRLQGPAKLSPGEEWVLPVEMLRGEAEDFRVHFVAASENHLWTSPLNDLTVQPPVDNGSGGGESPEGGDPAGGLGGE
ncbi:MAG: hypothetical protein R3E97_18650 [Candidatus Eisenbacteria bacterium]